MSVTFFIIHSVIYFLSLITVFVFIKSVFEISNPATYFLLTGLGFVAAAAVMLFVNKYNMPAALFYLVSIVFELGIPLFIKGTSKFHSFMTALIYSFFVYFSQAFFTGAFSLNSNIINTDYFDYIGYAINIIVVGTFILFSTVLINQTRYFSNSVSKYIIILLAIFLFVGGTLNNFAATVDNKIDYRIIYLKIFVLLITLAFIVLFPVLIYNQIKKSQYKYENELYEQQLNTQLEYYKCLSQSGYELRKFRHDYLNLSLGLKKVVSSDEGLELLEKYDEEIISSFQIMYNTGCDIADAILTDKQKKVADKIKINFEGSLKNINSDNLDLCVLLNNTLDIATLLFDSNTSYDKTIDIKARCVNGCLLYKLSSPVSNNISIKHNKIKSPDNSNIYTFYLQTLGKLIKERSGNINFGFSDNNLDFDIKYQF